MSSPNDTIIPVKTCTRCGRELPATTEFWHRSRRYKYGLYSVCKSCRKAEDPTRARERAREWRVKNPERAKENDRAKDPEKARERSRDWYLKNTDRAKERMRQDRLTNPDKFRDGKRKYKLDHPEAVKAAHHRRRARKRSLPDTITSREIQFAFSYFNNCCAVCGHQMNGFFTEPHLDHWIPLTSPDCPGSIPTNMVPLCSNCNIRKKDADPSEWLIRMFGMKKGSIIKKRVEAFFSSLEKVE